MTDLRDQFAAAYDRYADAIYRHCYFRVHSRAKAEELVQETFLKTWVYLSEGSRVDNLRAFLYRVANNLVIDDARRKRERSLEDLLESRPALEPAGNVRLEDDVLIKEIIRDLDRLPDADRELIIWRYVDDLDPREIAEILDETANNVSVRLHRAVQKLKELII